MPGSGVHDGYPLRLGEFELAEPEALVDDGAVIGELVEGAWGWVFVVWVGRERAHLEATGVDPDELEGGAAGEGDGEVLGLGVGGGG